MTQAIGAPAIAAAEPRIGQLRRTVSLTRELAFTQFKLKYTGSVLGYLWSLLKPAMLFAINYAVFSSLLKAGAGTPNFPLQLLIGIVFWTFLSDTVSVAISSIVANGNLIRKAYFPRAILVVSSSLSALLSFLINITLVVVVAASVGRLDLGMRSLAVFPLIIELYALILGISMLLSSLFVYYRDLGHVWDITSQVLFYGSAIVYPFLLVPSRLQTLVGINPIAQVVEDVRHALVSADPVHVPWMSSVLGAAYVVPIAIAAGMFVLGSLVFRRLSPSFAENL